MKILLLPLAALLTLPAQAQLSVYAGRLEAVSEAGRSLRERLAPAQADPAVVKLLMNRAIAQGDSVETEDGPARVLFGEPIRKGRYAPDEVGIVLYGDDLPDREVGAPGSQFFDLTLRSVFSRMEAGSSRAVARKNGSERVDDWTYTLHLDGTIAKVRHGIIILRPDGDGGKIVDPKASRWYDMSPRDPAVLRRWKKLESELLLLGRRVGV